MENPTIISAKEAADLLTATEGRIFSVRFIKRTTGEERVMTARTGVKKHLKGGKAAYDAAEKDLIFVYDLSAEGYRTIALDAITALRINGEQYEVAE